MPETTLAGRYRLTSKVAAGAMGEVWVGEDLVLQRTVAVKLMRSDIAAQPDAMARFRAEALYASRLAHRGIARVYDFGDGQPPFLVMEYVPGPSLETVLSAGPLDAWRTADIMAQAAEALAAAHAEGLVHRDVKPANLLIGPSDEVKVTDFGIAYAIGAAGLTCTGLIFGTPAYLAPERIAGQSATPAADLYSLGVIGYECLTGRRPFAGTMTEIALAHQARPMPLLPAWVPAPLRELIGDLTAKDPRDRPASAAATAARAAAVRSELLYEAQPGPRQFFAETAFTAAGPFAVHRSGRWPLRVGAAGLAAASLTGWLVTQYSAGQPAGQSSAAESLMSGRPRNTGPVTTSRGSVTVRQSSLVGRPVAAAIAELRSLGLRPVVSFRLARGLAAGLVAAVSPAGRVPAGARVVVFVSWGRDSGSAERAAQDGRQAQRAHAGKAVPQAPAGPAKPGGPGKHKPPKPPKPPKHRGHKPDGPAQLTRNSGTRAMPPSTTI